MLPPPAFPERTVTVASCAVTVRFATLVAFALADPEQANMYVADPAALGVTTMVPLVACVPVHAPLAVQEVALVEDQVSVALCPTMIEVGLTVRVTVGAGVAAVTVKAADALALPPAPVQVRV
jgi:hypothetical protein